MSNISFLPVALSEKAWKPSRLIVETNCKVLCSLEISVSVHVIYAGTDRECHFRTTRIVAGEERSLSFSKEEGHNTFRPPFALS